MKRNNFWKFWLLFVTPVATSIAAVSCSSSQNKDQPSAQSQPQPDKSPEKQVEPPKPKDETSSSTQEDPSKHNNAPDDTQNPDKHADNTPKEEKPNSAKGQEGTKPDKKPDQSETSSQDTKNEQPSVEIIQPAKSDLGKKLRQDLEQLVLYKNLPTVKEYNEFFENLEKSYQKGFSKIKNYTKWDFSKDVWFLQDAYAQVIALNQKIGTMNQEELNKYVQDQKQKSNNIFTYTDKDPKVNVDKVNQLFSNLSVLQTKSQNNDEIPGKPKDNSIKGLVHFPGFGWVRKDLEEARKKAKPKDNSIPGLFHLPGFGYIPSVAEEVKKKLDSVNTIPGIIHFPGFGWIPSVAKEVEKSQKAHKESSLGTKTTFTTTQSSQTSQNTPKAPSNSQSPSK
ncbi:hypothetical protein NPA08_03710 [Mycoplasmopsis citelli]|uniref:hypothetical protein n=1 Tax=Mycoplasmopsis citelli TaxID=171281 RepID=UPI002114F515|nr:hypothetical protein [Mycoplasmopsis citelli]UUD36033.1 hypothetical protein NPA08_03710 [Mycoplasmopsis citelli]